MKKTLLTILALTIGLFFVRTQALAGPITGVNPKGTPPNPAHTPKSQNTPGAQATEHANQNGKGRHQNFRGTIAAVDSSSLTLTLGDGSSVPFSLTPDTRIKIPGRSGSSAGLQVGMQAMVQAVADESGNLTALAVMAIPGRPVRAHRVGWVTAYTPGVSITIQASDGNTYTFALTAGAKILPAELASQLAVSSRVTIIAPRDPGSLGWTAMGIVVHPAGSGGGSMPPTATSTPSEVPSATPTP